MATLINDSFGSIGGFEDSMLTEVQFQALHGPGWILADGRSVTGSKYHTITSNTNVPDARGIFRRGKNNGRVDGSQNPDGDVALGTFQADAFGSHTHSQNSHAHTQQVPAGGGGAGIASSQSASYTGSVSSYLTTSSATATNNNSGGNETRAKNISANVFIRIN